jgi:hemerythrin-like metal-binding protein
MKFRWKDDYKVGHEEIDSQHKTLFDLVGDFIESKHDSLMSDALKVYEHSKFHFDFEESIMKEVQFSNYLSHIEQHKKLLKVLEEVIVSITNKTFIKNKTDIFIAEWLVKHTAIEDTKLSDFIKKRYK